MTQWSSGHQQQPQYYAPPPPPPPRRNTVAVALIASLSLLVVLVVAIIVVIAVRRGDGSTATPAASAPTTRSGPVDTCLIGNWRQSQYGATMDLSSVSDGKNKPLGTVRVTGSGRLWRITADGRATEDFTSTRYSGRTDDGRGVDLTFTGTNEWTLKTQDGQLLFVSTGSTVELTITVDGKQAEKTRVEPHNNPQPYTCLPNSWKTQSLTDTTASAQYDRV
ncbi:hypothetical protein ACFFX1_47410 [Dactylosporangium sucinum]|uniref:Uncharacterized protein n=1 Tax=Dactylosporangium sucinum TaxID=1424081 RepID=A0A917X6B6_9ACTN|nr:hypothetical protein [Dactylosporangium sucinum]GGM73374.1 hypothetical protein GCM10007977_088720 [Dactylosporangium sucinum]